MILCRYLCVPLMVLVLGAACDSLNGGDTGGGLDPDWGIDGYDEVVPGTTAPLVMPPMFNPSCSSEPTGPAVVKTFMEPYNNSFTYPRKILIDGYNQGLVIDEELWVLKIGESHAFVQSPPEGINYCMPADIAITANGSYIISSSRIVQTVRQEADYIETSPLLKLASGDLEITQRIIDRLSAQENLKCEAGVNIYDTQAKQNSAIVTGYPLINPTGMEINSEGMIILVDSRLEMVLAIDPDDGEVITIQDNEIFSNAMGLTVGSDNLIYTVHSNKKLVRIDPQSRELTVLYEGSPLVMPTGITRDCLDQLIITDSAADAVFSFNTASGEMTLISADAQFIGPMDAAVDMDNNLLIIDQSSAVFKIER
jgi:hypothetical protein